MLTSAGRGAPTDMDDSIIRDFVSQVSQVILPHKELRGGVPSTPSTPSTPSIPGTPGGTPSTPGGTPNTGGGSGTRAPGVSSSGTRAPSDSGAPSSTTNADGTPAPANAGAVRSELTATSTRPKTDSEDHSPEGKKKQTDDAEKQKNDWLSKVGGLGGLAMIGLTVALATTIAAKSIADYTACVNANVSITKIVPTPRVPSWVPAWQWLINLFPLPKTVDITYTVDTSYKPLAKSDTWDITGTGTMIDRNAVMIEKVLKGKSIRIKCGSDDCSNVKSTTGGSANVNCDFADRLNEAVGDVATDIGSKVSRLVEKVGSGFLQFLPIIILIVAIYFGFMLFK